MRMLTVSLVVCAMMALTRAAAVPEPVPRVGPFIQEGNSPLVKDSRSCPSGWTAHNGRCFYYVPTPMTWANAEETWKEKLTEVPLGAKLAQLLLKHRAKGTNCQSWGGNLASVHSFDEHHVIQSMIVRITHMYPLTWLGGCDAAQEGTWFWSDGTPFRFNFWDIGQPDNRGNAHCLLMNFGENKKFDDQPCYYNMPFVCAKKL